MFPQHDCVLCRGTADHGYGCTRPSISPAYISAVENAPRCAPWNCPTPTSWA
jgi:hypothetical protein